MPEKKPRYGFEGVIAEVEAKSHEGREMIAITMSQATVFQEAKHKAEGTLWPGWEESEITPALKGACVVGARVKGEYYLGSGDRARIETIEIVELPKPGAPAPLAANGGLGPNGAIPARDILYGRLHLLESAVKAHEGRDVPVGDLPGLIGAAYDAWAPRVLPPEAILAVAEGHSEQGAIAPPETAAPDNGGPDPDRCPCEWGGCDKVLTHAEYDWCEQHSVFYDGRHFCRAHQSAWKSGERP